MKEPLDVLIVDDEQPLAEALAAHLSKYPITVKYATKVCNAITIVKQQHPKIAIVDVFLPDLDGFDLAEEIFTYAPECKIILMSGLYDFNQQHLVQLGFEDFLKKPIDFAELDQVLKKYQLFSNN